MSLLKTTHANSMAAQSAKLRRLGAKGNLKMARKGEHAPRKYASGGAVSDMGPVEGAQARPRLDRPGRSKGAKKDGKKGTTVNIVIASGAKPGGPPGDGPMPPPPGAGPMPPKPMPPMPPPGPGGPPMRKHGGSVGKFAKGGRIANLGKYAHGGKVKRAAGGRVGYDVGGSVPAPGMGWFGGLPAGLEAQGLREPPQRPWENKMNQGALQGQIGGMSQSGQAERLMGPSSPPPGLGGRPIPPPPTDGSKAGPAGGVPLPPPPMMGDGPQGFMGGPPGPMPGRKHGGSVGRYAKGGKVHRKHRADGGWTGEGDSGKPMKEKSAMASKAADNEGRYAALHAGLGAGSTGMAALAAKARSPGVAAANLGAGAFNTLAAFSRSSQEDKKRKEARDANKAGDEAEGKKRGGSVKRGKC